MSIVDEILMISYWLTNLSKSIHKAESKELKEVLRFSREYLRDRIFKIVIKVDKTKVGLPHEIYLSAIHASYECEIKECERALKGTDEIWNAYGSKMSDKQIRSQLKIKRSQEHEFAQKLHEIRTTPGWPND